jgi:hypothetical protein
MLTDVHLLSPPNSKAVQMCHNRASTALVTIQHLAPMGAVIFGHSVAVIGQWFVRGAGRRFIIGKSSGVGRLVWGFGKGYTSRFATDRVFRLSDRGNGTAGAAWSRRFLTWPRITKDRLHAPSPQRAPEAAIFYGRF